MSDGHTLYIAARRADSLALVSYNTYVRTQNPDALRQAGEHAYVAVHALMEADGIPASGAQELIDSKLPGVRTVMHAAAEQIASETAVRLRQVWRLMRLPGTSPSLDDRERDLAKRLLITALVSDDVEILDVRERVEHIPHRRAAQMLLNELERSELPWKAALPPHEYRHLVHRYAPRSGAGRGCLCAAVKRLDVKERVIAILADWLDGGAQGETLAPCLNAALAACLPAVLV